MEQHTVETRPTPDPATAIGWVALTVAGLERSTQFYTQVLGFELLEQEDGGAVLGIGSTPLLTLAECAGAQPKPARATGLYHFAILVPTRAALGRSLRQLAATGYPLGGHADHLVSEALYLSDPDGNGIEIYRDRPRSAWQWHNGTVQMASEPIDLAQLVREADEAGEAWSGLTAGTTIGHVHLQIGDVAEAEAFYHGVLGFDVAARWPGALFVSAGGYHHHLGLNTWTSRNGPPQPPDGAGLRAFAISVPDSAALRSWAQQIRSAGVEVAEDEDSFVVIDPWRIRIIVAAAERVADTSALLQRVEAAGLR